MMCLIFHKFFCDTVQFILEAEMNFNLCFAMNIYVVDQFHHDPAFERFDMFVLLKFFQPSRKQCVVL